MPVAPAVALVNLNGVVPIPQTEVRVLGRYALYDEIAAGGMATVHIGRLLGPVGFSRTVAIKRLHAQFAKDPEFVSMFLDEARLAARIRHPNVIGTLDVVALAGELFLVMEYVPGESFARLWRTSRESGRPIPVPIAVSILVGILEGLHAAHEATNDRGEPLGIVHRDVSPHNILVGTDGVARVLDFGVAKATGRLQTTRDGQLKGKISYMAPEQVHGSVDRTTDVYAASVVLWEALTGRRLFFAENEARTLANVLYPKVEAPSRIAEGISTDLDAIVMRGLSSTPANRFATAREMARALQTAAPPAPAFAVGDWVESTAGATIQDRASRVASIERSLPPESDPHGVSFPSSPPPISRVGLRVPQPTLDSSSPPYSPAPEHEEGAAAVEGEASLWHSRGRTAVAIGLVSLVVGFGCLTALGVVRRAPEPYGTPLPTPPDTKTATAAGRPRSPPLAPSKSAAPATSPPMSTAAATGAALPSRTSAFVATQPPPSGLSPSAGASSAVRTPGAPSSIGGATNRGAPHPPPTTMPAKPPADDGEFDHVIDSRK
ncbi:MAG: protein kinase [Polyangiaceae bacterium]|jgi:serine/threonine-protein kinase